MREYFDADAHAAIITPTTPTEETARAKKMPTSRSSANPPGDSGRTAIMISVGIRTTPGAAEKTRLSAAAGMMSSFWMNLMPSATSCSAPKGPASIGPRRFCMNAMTLCSWYPATSGATRKNTMTAPSLRISDSQKLSKAKSDSAISGAPRLRPSPDYLDCDRHRSTSPTTKKTEPRMAIMSAISWSFSRYGMAWTLENDGVRIFMRHGVFCPSLTR